jgi:hypothetical protein
MSLIPPNKEEPSDRKSAAIMSMKDLSTNNKKRRSKLKLIVNAIQFYDGDTLGFPLAEYRGKGHFQGINKGDTVDGACWPPINGHKIYAKIYRVTSIRHTIQEKPDGTIKHLKSVFVDPVL